MQIDQDPNPHRTSGKPWKMGVLCLLQMAWLPCTSWGILTSGTTVTFQASDQTADNTSLIQGYLNNPLYNKFIIQSGSNSASWIVGPLTVGHDNTQIVLSGSTTLETKTGAYALYDCLLQATNKANVTISGTTGSTLLMHRDEYASSGTSDSEWRHAIGVWSCTTVTIEGLALLKTGGDGIYIGDSGGGTGGCADVAIDNVVADGAARNGISVISVNGLNISNCTFKNTQGTGNLATGGPWAGIDLEPNSPTEHLKNVVIDSCAFLGNGHYGFLVSTKELNGSPDALNIGVSNSLMQGNKWNGIAIANVPATLDSSSKIDFKGCVIMDHQRSGILLQDKTQAGALVSFESCYLKNNSITASSIDAPIAVVNNSTATGGGGGVTLDNVVVEQTLDRSVLPPCLLVQGTLANTIDSVNGTLYASGGTVSTVYASNVGVSPASSIPASYWKLDETSGTTVGDSTGSSPGVIWNNAVQSPGRVGGALQMDGVSQYAEITTNSSNLDVGTGDFSISLWFQRFNSSTTNSRLFAKGAAASYDPGYALLGSNTSLTFLLSNGSVRRSISISIPALNQWNHLACTISRAGMMTLYLNGILKSQLDVSDWAGESINSIRNLLLGSCYNITNLNWPGLIDDVRVYHRTLSAGEVLEMCQKPASYWTLNETSGTATADNTGRCDGTLQGNPSRVVGQAGGALSFSGSGQYVEMAANSSDIDVGQSDFTIAFWFQRFSSTISNGRLFYKGASADSDPGCAILGSNSKVTFLLCNGSTRRMIAGNIPATNQWVHLACTINRSGMMTLYINGKFADQIDVSDWAGLDIASVRNGMMGRCGSLTTLDWPGAIDDVRIYKRALSEIDVQKVFMAYSPTVLR